MSDWRATLERASALSNEASRHLPALIRLLESVVAGQATAEDVHRVLGSIVERRPGFVEAIDAALRSSRRDQPGFDAARAVLSELPFLLDRIVAIPPLGPAPDTALGAAATLACIHARERDGSHAGEHSSLACPRCGSRRVETQHTDAFERREIEVRCAECGNHGGWTEGDEEGTAWQQRSRVALTEAFIEYLRSGASRPHRLAAELRASGVLLAGTLLEREGWQSSDDGGRVFVGRKPPHDAAPGDLWLDSVEVMPMVLVEEPTYRNDRTTQPVWLALRPVMRWQFRAFAAAAPIVGRTVQIELPIRMLDPERLAGDELAPITSIIEAEAELYAEWFGKVLGTRSAWQGAARTLGARAASLWAPGLLEWTAELCSFDESLRARIGPEDVDSHPDDEYIANCEGRAERRVLAGEAAHDPSTGLRTMACTPLLTEISDTFRPFVSITLDHVYPR